MCPLLEVPTGCLGVEKANVFLPQIFDSSGRSHASLWPLYSCCLPSYAIKQALEGGVQKSMQMWVPAGVQLSRMGQASLRGADRTFQPKDPATRHAHRAMAGAQA